MYFDFCLEVLKPHTTFFRDLNGLWYIFMEKGSRFYSHTYSYLLFNNIITEL